MQSLFFTEKWHDSYERELLLQVLDVQEELTRYYFTSTQKNDASSLPVQFFLYSLDYSIQD
jgi:hypothetical protein